MLRQLAANHVAENVYDLLGGAGGGLGGAVDLLEGVVELAVVEGDDRLAEGGGKAGVESRVPLALFVAEADDHDARETWRNRKNPASTRVFAVSREC